MNANPRDFPVSSCRTRLTSTISPYCENTARTSPSVRSNESPPANTYAECLYFACQDAPSLKPRRICGTTTTTTDGGMSDEGHDERARQIEQGCRERTSFRVEIVAEGKGAARELTSLSVAF
eukprot:30957-Pelagococcus_subviridis.AAC.6